jgi:hypothetical protein
LLEYIERGSVKGVAIDEAFAYIRSSLPKANDFDEVWKGLKRSGLIEVRVVGGKQVFKVPQLDAAGG